MFSLLKRLSTGPTLLATPAVFGLLFLLILLKVPDKLVYSGWQVVSSGCCNGYEGERASGSENRVSLFPIHNIRYGIGMMAS